MNNTNESIIKRAISLIDNLAQLDSMIQKLDMLSNDFCYNYLENFDVSLENINAEHELKLIKTMAEVMRDYSSEAAKISSNLPDAMENILANIRINSKTATQQ